MTCVFLNEGMAQPAESLQSEFNLTPKFERKVSAEKQISFLFCPKQLCVHVVCTRFAGDIPSVSAGTKHCFQLHIMTFKAPNDLL